MHTAQPRMAHCSTSKCVTLLYIVLVELAYDDRLSPPPTAYCFVVCFVFTLCLAQQCMCLMIAASLYSNVVVNLLWSRGLEEE